MSFINRGPGGKLAKINRTVPSQAASTNPDRRVPADLVGRHQGPKVANRYGVHQRVCGRCPDRRSGGWISTFAGYLGVPSFSVAEPLMAKANGRRPGSHATHEDHDVARTSDGSEGG